MDAKELIKKVRKIEIRTRKLSSQVFSGSYHSAFKGRGMSFSEVREYQYGDDIRAIDWNVTARFDTPFIKIFEEERELVMMLMIDISGSSFFGSRDQFKNELIAEIAAVLAFSASSNNDKIGAILFSDHVEKFIPPKKGRPHILRIIREIIDHEPVGKGTSISEVLRYFNNVIKKRSIAFMLTDFMDDNYEDALKIANRKHDLTAIQLYDPAEVTLPNLGLVRMRAAESGELHWVDTSSKKVREAYAESFEKHRRQAIESCMRSGVDLLRLEMHDNEEANRKHYIRELMNLFKRRETKR
jgi:uncharacterized protein (DUF58 family)